MDALNKRDFNLLVLLLSVLTGVAIPGVGDRAWWMMAGVSLAFVLATFWRQLSVQTALIAASAAALTGILRLSFG